MLGAKDIVGLSASKKIFHQIRSLFSGQAREIWNRFDCLQAFSSVEVEVELAVIAGRLLEVLIYILKKL